jgi:hypothetical protein
MNVMSAAKYQPMKISANGNNESYRRKPGAGENNGNIWLISKRKHAMAKSGKCNQWQWRHHGVSAIITALKWHHGNIRRNGVKAVAENAAHVANQRKWHHRKAMA